MQARIDSHSKVLYARLTNTRAATFERALQTGARPHAPVPLVSVKFLETCIMARAESSIPLQWRACLKDHCKVLIMLVSGVL